MKIEVEMWAFCEGKIREVEIPADKCPESVSESVLLEMVFHFGQNDFQPLPIPSVSVGDVVLLNGARFLCRMSGWKELNEADYQSHVSRNYRYMVE